MPDLLTARPANQPDKLAVAYADLFSRIRADVPKVEHLLVFDGDAPDGMIACDPLVASASTEPVLKRELRQPFWAGHGSNV